MINLFARPYDLGATGFFFESAEEFAQKAAALKNEAGQPVEEFELQFIDGERLDAELFAALMLFRLIYNLAPFGIAVFGLGLFEMLKPVQINSKADSAG